MSNIHRNTYSVLHAVTNCTSLHSSHEETVSPHTNTATVMANKIWMAKCAQWWNAEVRGITKGKHWHRTTHPNDIVGMLFNQHKEGLELSTAWFLAKRKKCYCDWLKYGPIRSRLLVWSFYGKVAAAAGSLLIPSVDIVQILWPHPLHH